MPIYEYRCQDCGIVFEIILFSASTRVTCPACHAGNVERQPSAFAIAGSQARTTAGASCSGCRRSSCAGCQ